MPAAASPKPRHLWTLLDAPWIDPNNAHTAHSSQFIHSLGTFGYPFHVAFAAFACFSMAGPVVLVEIGAMPLLVCWVLRLPFVWQGIPVILRQPFAVFAVAWLLWLMLSITWSPDRAAGWHEAAYSRWMWLALAIWPVLDRRPWFIAALCVGFACAHAAQLAELFVVREGGTLFSHPPAPDPLARISGWWHQPAAGGVMCVTSLGLHIAPALMGHGWRRWAGLGGTLVAGAALLLTGSRGSMLAACALVCVVGTVALVRSLATARSTQSPLMQRLSRRRAAALLLATLTLVVVGFWVIAGESVTSRLSLARDELSRVRQGDTNSDIGARVIAARAAMDAFTTAPFLGHGAGSFSHLSRAYATDRAIPIDDFRLQKLATAHSTPLQAVATTGLVGGGLLLGAWGCALWGAGRARIGTLTWTEDLGTYHAAPLFALAALCFASAFETLYLNNTMQAVACLLMALCPVVRPRVVSRATPTGASA